MDVIYNFSFIHAIQRITNGLICHLINTTNIHTRNFFVQLKQVDHEAIIVKLLLIHWVGNNLRKKPNSIRVISKAQDYREQLNRLQRLGTGQMAPLSTPGREIHGH